MDWECLECSVFIKNTICQYICGWDIHVHWPQINVKIGNFYVNTISRLICWIEVRFVLFSTIFHEFDEV